MHAREKFSKKLASSKKLIHAKQNKTTFSFYIFMKLLFHIIMATRMGSVEVGLEGILRALIQIFSQNICARSSIITCSNGDGRGGEGGRGGGGWNLLFIFHFWSRVGGLGEGVTNFWQREGSEGPGRGKVK